MFIDSERILCRYTHIPIHLDIVYVIGIVINYLCILQIIFHRHRIH